MAITPADVLRARSVTAPIVLAAASVAIPRRRIQCVHCASPTAWLRTSRGGAASPGRRYAENETGRIRSPAMRIDRVSCSSTSRFAVTGPSRLFSSAITPAATVPASTASSTSSAVSMASSSSPGGASSSAARWLKVPSGPR
jgi:hypothetical protein